MTGNELQAVVLPEGVIQLEWAEASAAPEPRSAALQQEIFTRYGAEPDEWLLALGFSDKNIALAPSLAFWRRLAGRFARRLSLTPDLEQLRDKARILPDQQELAELLAGLPPMTGGEYVDGQLLLSLWEGLNLSFARRLGAWRGSVAELLKGYSPAVHLVGRIYFHLVENRQGNEPFAFLATYSTGLNDKGESRHLPLRHALQEYGGNSKKLLELLVTVQEAAGKSRLVRELLASGELFHPLAWSAREAYEFLQEIPLYEDSGILCRIPNWWKAKGATIRVAVSVGNQTPAMVGMAALLDFRPRLIVGEEEISEEEARRLLAESEGLAFIKNKWVAVDPQRLQQTLAAYEQAKKLASGEGISILEAMRLAINPQLLAPGDGEAEGSAQGVAHGEWLASVFEKMRHPEKIGRVRTGPGFAAQLRRYQQQGLQWLFFLHRLRFGACLADDMGLGKTVQVLAFLDALQEEMTKSGRPRRASLLIIPASLIANWLDEIARFAPRLTCFVAHPDLHRPGPMPELDPDQLDCFALVITTYGLAQRYAWLAEHEWDYVILDEAQAIKNPGAKQTRAIKKFAAANRIVMTGTPIENRLSDLWSLFDFLNPGLLGTAKEFGGLVKRLASAPAGFAGLRGIISPFILRRLKTDKSIIADLPDKVEVKTWAALSRKQAVLYGQLVEGLRESIEAADGIKRKGLILAALMKCKQLCNHPAQYLGAGEFSEEESGKFARLREICETIYEKREKLLIFTQFKEMTGPLARFLAGIFGREGLVLHGSVPVAKRKELIARFQGPGYVPYLVLSLKAGGVGLNLTAASHVIHFDRWWNPAVENQATDRAFRIGQKKNVMVHKFLTKGTIEEKIDAMLEQKARLSSEVIAATGENWITEMDNKELVELFTLKL